MRHADRWDRFVPLKSAWARRFFTSRLPYLSAIRVSPHNRACPKCPSPPAPPPGRILPGALNRGFHPRLRSIIAPRCGVAAGCKPEAWRNVAGGNAPGSRASKCIRPGGAAEHSNHSSPLGEEVRPGDANFANFANGREFVKCVSTVPSSLISRQRAHPADLSSHSSQVFNDVNRSKRPALAVFAMEQFAGRL